MVSPRRATRPIVAIYPRTGHRILERVLRVAGRRRCASVASPPLSPFVNDCVPCIGRRRRARADQTARRRPTEFRTCLESDAPPAQPSPRSPPSRPAPASRSSCAWASGCGIVGLVCVLLAAGSLRLPLPDHRHPGPATRTSRPRRPTSTTTTARPSSGSSRPEPRVDPARRDAADHPGRRGRGREPVLLDRQGHRPQGHPAGGFSNARGNATQGASTITQQYVKILYLTQERTLDPQGQGSDPLAEAAAPAEQEGDPRGLPQHDLLRPRRLRHPGRLPGVLRHRTPRSSACGRARSWPAS